MKTIKNFKKIFLALFFLVLAMAFMVELSADNEREYAKIALANKAYTDGKFQEAADIYEKILKKGFTAPELNYNLGNAYYRLGDYKRAILNYERALLQNPDNEDVLTNLEFAQQYIQDKIEIVPIFFIFRWSQAFVDMFSANVWSYISISTFIMVLSLIIVFLFTKIIPLRKLSVYFGILLFLFSLISFYCAYKQNSKRINHNTAIIFSPAATVKSSPSKTGTDLFIIHEGLKVSITDELEDWKEIRLADGRIGWLPAESLAEI